MTEVLIASACRTPIGSFQGALAALSASDLGAVAVREAVKRAGIEPAQVERVIMGNVLSAGIGQAPARQAVIKAGLPVGGRRDHGQQGLRLGPAGGDVRAPRDPRRRRRDRRRRRHGVDDQRAVRAAAGARRLPHGQRPDHRHDDPRRPLGSVQQLPHGQLRRHGRDQVRLHARGAGRVRAPSLPPGARRAGKRQVQGPRSCRCEIAGKKGDRRSSTRTRSPKRGAARQVRVAARRRSRRTARSPRRTPRRSTTAPRRWS